MWVADDDDDGGVGVKSKTHSKNVSNVYDSEKFIAVSANPLANSIQKYFFVPNDSRFM